MFLECSLGLEDGSALLADVGLDVRMLPLDVLPDVGEGIAIELTDPTLVVLLPIVSFEVELLVLDVTEGLTTHITDMLRLFMDQNVL